MKWPPDFVLVASAGFGRADHHGSRRCSPDLRLNRFFVSGRGRRDIGAIETVNVFDRERAE